MGITAFLEKLKSRPSEISFQEVIAYIDAKYEFIPTAFSNGEVKNEAGQNNGSCKIFAFGKLIGLSKEETLACFGDYYRKDVLENPDGDDHQNIRNFIKFGWQGLEFEGVALVKLLPE
jgi:hypothetical protein